MVFKQIVNNLKEFSYQQLSQLRHKYSKKDIKEEKKTGSKIGLYKYLKRAAKALIVSKPIIAWQNIAEFGKYI